MAITSLEYHVLRELHARKFLPPKPVVLELGLNEWYGDVSIQSFIDDLQLFAPDLQRRSALASQIYEIAHSERPDRAYEMARLFLNVFLDPSELKSIDPGTGRGALPFDLNHPIQVSKQVDIVLNIGTAEHVFNIGQFYKSVHEITREGGLMIHHSPFFGWPDHGFYSIQPTLFWDLARENGYEIIAFLCGRFKPYEVMQLPSREATAALIESKNIALNSVLHVVFRKTSRSGEFKFPMQGFYANELPPEAQRNWMKAR